MDFIPSQRILSRLECRPNQAHVARTLPIPVFVAIKRRTQLRQFARCAFSGVYEAELAETNRYIWTQANASIDCYFATSAKLRYVWFEVAATAPGGSRISVQLDNVSLLRDHFVRGRTTVRLALPEARVLSKCTLAVQSSTFIPSEAIDASQDGRELGVALRGIVFGKRMTKYQSGLMFRKPIKMRIAKLIGQWRRKRAA